MERIFWVECGGCRGKFYCSYREMRHSGIALMCPFCRLRFLPEQAASLDDRWVEAEGASGTPPPRAGP